MSYDDDPCLCGHERLVHGDFCLDQGCTCPVFELGARSDTGCDADWAPYGAHDLDLHGMEILARLEAVSAEHLPGTLGTLAGWCHDHPVRAAQVIAWGMDRTPLGEIAAAGREAVRS